ncbi:hypothetical protein F8M41_026422 [Gigaspora margarita]|uniref:Uncharacterized protein n=1 Tax=Gigaspora margarita TaxID=4874 RepID=A0A8H3XJD6_GIGMA|nr:hypothetical protein F8M41_026422 [Gigaspora margarita]
MKYFLLMFREELSKLRLNHKSDALKVLRALEYDNLNSLERFANEEKHRTLEEIKNQLASLNVDSEILDLELINTKGGDVMYIKLHDKGFKCRFGIWRAEGEKD